MRQYLLKCLQNQLELAQFWFYDLHKILVCYKAQDKHIGPLFCYIVFNVVGMPAFM